MNKLIPFALMAMLALALAPLPSHAALQADQGGIKLKPEEFKAYEAVKMAATVEEALANAKGFSEKFPGSPALSAVEEEVYIKIANQPVDAKRIEHIAAFKSAYPASKWISILELESVDYYIGQGNFAEVNRIGEASLARDPENIRVHVLLLRIAVDAIKKNDGSLVASGQQHGTKAMAIFEGAARPASFATDQDWADYKTKNASITYQSMGIIAFATGQTPNAGGLFEKAIVADAKDPLNYFFLANLRLNEYDALAQQFNKMPDRKSAEATKVLEDANKKLDSAIDLLVKTVALSDAQPPIQQAARPILEQQYKQRNNGKLDGLEQKIKAAKGGA